VNVIANRHKVSMIIGAKTAVVLYCFSNIHIIMSNFIYGSPRHFYFQWQMTCC